MKFLTHDPYEDETVTRYFEKAANSIAEANGHGVNVLMSMHEVLPNNLRAYYRQWLIETFADLVQKDSRFVVWLNTSSDPADTPLADMTAFYYPTLNYVMGNYKAFSYAVSDEYSFKSPLKGWGRIVQRTLKKLGQSYGNIMTALLPLAVHSYDEQEEYLERIAEVAQGSGYDSESLPTTSRPETRQDFLDAALFLLNIELHRPIVNAEMLQPRRALQKSAAALQQIIFKGKNKKEALAVWEDLLMQTLG